MYISLLIFASPLNQCHTFSLEVSSQDSHRLSHLIAHPCGSMAAPRALERTYLPPPPLHKHTHAKTHRVYIPRHTAEGPKTVTRHLEAGDTLRMLHVDWAKDVAVGLELKGYGNATVHVHTASPNVCFAHSVCLSVSLCMRLFLSALFCVSPLSLRILHVDWVKDVAVGLELKGYGNATVHVHTASPNVCFSCPPSLCVCVFLCLCLPVLLYSSVSLYMCVSFLSLCGCCTWTGRKTWPWGWS